jgi:hypothetical protein
MNFAEALGILLDKNPEKHMAIQRDGWNGKGMFVYAVGSNAYPATTEVA